MPVFVCVLYVHRCTFSICLFYCTLVFAGPIAAPPHFPTADADRTFFLPSLRREDSPPGPAAAAVVLPIDSCQANLLRAQHLGVGGRSRSARNYKFEGDLHRWFTHPSAKYACDIARR